MLRENSQQHSHIDEITDYIESVLGKATVAAGAEVVEEAGGLALPVITNQKMNGHLKNLCELCGINSPITETCIRNGKRETEVYPKYAKIGTHAGRRYGKNRHILGRRRLSR